MNAEKWLPIPGYEGHYEVSDLGRIRSLTREIPHRRSGTQRMEGRIMATPLDSKGYPRVTLKTRGNSKSLSVHRLIMCAFEPREDASAMHVNHKDGVRHHSVYGNLEWCTASENRLHSYRVLHRRNGMTGKTGGLHHNAIAVIGQCIATGERRQYESMADVQRDAFNDSDVSACVLGAQKSHKGWLWRYADSPEPVAWIYQPVDTRGANNVHAKPVERINEDGSITWYAAASLAKVDGFNPVAISHVLHGRAKQHRGCVWRFAESATHGTSGGKLYAAA